MTEATFAQARDFFLQGVRDYEAGHFEQAQRQFEASLALLPGRPSTLTNLGAARLKLGRAEDALGVLDEALAQEPGNAEALGHRATALAELGRLQEALEGFDRVVALAPALAHAWTLRGSVLKDLGRTREAAASFREALARGGDAELIRYYLAGLEGRDAPPAAPRGYVQALFDGYAPAFDGQLVALLNYRAPQLLAQGLAALERHFQRGLDLGCGTGLCGPLLRPFTTAIDGVDLSAAMLERARQKHAYERLEQADLAEWLADAPAGRYDLVVSADVFIYVGALEQVFEGVARLLRPGGVFCFSVEEADGGEDLVLRPSLRYAHSAAYLQRLARTHGLEVLRSEREPIREEQREPIPGLYLWLEKRQAALRGT
jgi:predicted TPR repeat methyltransferase